MWYVIGLFAVYVVLATLGYLFIRGASMLSEGMEGLPLSRENGKSLRPLPSALRESEDYDPNRQGVIPILGRPDWRLLHPGAKATVVAYDPDAARCVASHEQPRQYAAGVSHVILNGKVVFGEGETAGKRPSHIPYGRARKAVSRIR